MSLTSFIAIPEIAMEMKRQFPMPEIKLSTKILVEPKTNKYGYTGTAFDYLMRFKLKQINKDATTRPWIAENATSLFSSQKLRKKAQHILLRAKIDYKQFISIGDNINSTIETVARLAQIDPVYRAGYEDQNLGEIDKLITQELEELLSLIDKNKFTAKNSCSLNPTFGLASIEIGGADADFIIDNCLIDIKTTKYAQLKRDNFNQLIGYYILSEIEQSEYKKGTKLDSLGIYFSRHGVLYTFPIAPLLKENHKEFVRWFRSKI